MKTVKKITSILPTIAGLALGVSVTNADVTYGGSFQSWQDDRTSNTDNVTEAGSSFDASGFDKLVVIATTENGNPSSPNGRIDTVTYDGVALTQAVFSLPIAADEGPPVVPWNQTYISIWFLDNPTTTGGVIATTGNNRIAATAFGLNGTAPGFGNTASVKPGYSATLTSSPGSIVVSALGMGGGGNNADVGNANPDSGTRIDGIEFGSNWGGHVTAYEEVSTAGTGTYAFTDSSPTDDVSVVAVEFLSGTPQKDLIITEVGYSPSTNEVTLTWPKTGAAAFNIELSQDLLDWESNLGTGITDADDEDDSDPDNITVTLALPDESLDSLKLFFRVEETTIVE